ncbi:MAG: serine/threonine-protein kinase [Dehalococcoidales bacterium]|nr:serine/threonine-protein kinase [Dehalococcoidales bacterium]
MSDKKLGLYRLAANELDNKVMLRIERDFTNRVLLAVDNQDPDAALRLYDEVKELPSTTTVAQLRVEGFAPVGALYGTTISSCITSDGEEKVIKILESREAVKYQEVADGLKFFDDAHHLVPFQLYARRSGALLAIMPMFPHTAEVLPLQGNLRLISRMILDISTAIKTMHSQHFAHMDIKPSNVFVRQGRFYLGDFGSATEFNERAMETTLPFIPVDLECEDAGQDHASKRRHTSGGWKADATHDWWMFAATIADKLFDLKLKGPRAPTCSDLLSLLQRHNTDAQIRGFVETLVPLIPKPTHPSLASSVRLLTPPCIQSVCFSVLTSCSCSCVPFLAAQSRIGGSSRWT